MDSHKLIRTFFVWLILLGTVFSGGRAAAQFPSFSKGAPCTVNSIINVKCPPYGAKGDGTTNDYAAIAAAITAAQAVKGCVVFPASANPYLFNTPIVITGTVCILGGPARLVYGGGATTTALTITGSGSGFAENVMANDITVDASGLATNAVILKQVFNSTFRNLSATNAITSGIVCQQCQTDLFTHPTVSPNVSGTFTTVPVNGLVFDRSATTSGVSSANAVIDPVMEQVSGAGLLSLNVSASMYISGGTLEANGIGANLSSSTAWVFQGVDIEQNTTVDIQLGASGTNSFFGSIGGPNVTLLTGSFNNLFVGGSYNQFTINAGATYSRLISIEVNYKNTGGLTNNGANTVGAFNTNAQTGVGIPDINNVFASNDFTNLITSENIFANFFVVNPGQSFRSTSTSILGFTAGGDGSAAFDTGLSRGAAGQINVGTGASGSVAGKIDAGAYLTGTNCSSSASPAVCGSAAAGSVAIPITTGVLVVNTSAVTANSQILLTFDSSLGTKLGITCNATEPALYGVSDRSTGVSFTITATAPAVNPACVSYFIVN